MKNFEMPKMNISIFSNENVVIAESAIKLAEAALNDLGFTASDSVTVSTSLTEWSKIN